MRLERVVERVGRIEGLDRVASPVSAFVGRRLRTPPVKDLLSGSWLGHPLHPMLTDVPIGSWTSAMVLDLCGGRRGEQAAEHLVGLGVVSAVPTVVSGLSDWSDSLGAERRIGSVHALANAVATGCYGVSWVARRRGARSWGVALGLVGAAVATAGGYLGAHLAFARGMNVNRNAWADTLDEWTPAAAESDLTLDEPVAGRAGETPILLVRQGGRIHAIANRCGHAGGPLHEGTLHDGCVVCPWHRSTFRLSDGALVHGPATGPQPSYEVSVEDGRVLVRSAPPR